MHPNTIEIITVRTENPAELHDQLDQGEKLLQVAAAASATQGILITCHDPSHYTLRLSDDVPFGITRSRYE
jgi:spore coat protein U-like protein